MNLIGRIMNASNAFLGVTNIPGTTVGAPSVNQTTWLPLGTPSASATGEIGVKVITIGSGGGTSSSQVQGTAPDGSAVVGNPVYVGGVGVVASTYTGTESAGQAVPVRVDTASGGLLVDNRKLTTTDDAIKMLPIVQASTLGTTSGRTAALVATAVIIKASAGNLYCLNLVNPNASIVYVKLYDATTVTVGTTAIRFTIVLAANGQFTMRGTDSPINFATGIGIACVTGVADINSTAPATGVITEYEYV